MRQRYAGLGSVGLNTDVQPSLLDEAAWTVLDNVACEDGSLRSTYGELRKYELPVRPKYYATLRAPTNEWFMVVSDGSQVWAAPLETGLYANITPTTGPWPTGYVSFANLNSMVVVNSDKAGAFYLDYALGKLVPLPGWDPAWRCREMVAFRYYLVALGMIETKGTLGTEMLTPAGWTVPSDWDQVSAGVFSYSPSVLALTHPAAIVSAKKYKCTYTVTGRTAGSVTISFGGQTSPAVTATGVFTATATNTNAFTVTPTAAFNGGMTFSLMEETSPGVFGPELLTVADWVVPAGWTQAPAGTFTYALVVQDLTHSAAIVSAKQYRIDYTVTGAASGSVTISVGGKTSSAINASGSWIVTTTGTTGFKITPTKEFSGTITPTMQEITGYSEQNYPHKLRWSSSAEDGAVPAEWLPTLENDAGDDLLGETPGHIVGGVLMRDALYVIKEDAAYVMSYVGGQFVMRVDRMHGATGTPLQKGYVEMKGALVTCSTRDLVAFDGHTATSVATGRVREALQETISDQFWSETQVFRHNPTTTLWIAGSSGTVRLDSALVFNWGTGTWFKKLLNYGYGLMALPVVSGKKPLTEIALLESDISDTTWWASVLAGSDTNSDGTPKVCTAERVGLPIEGADGVVMVREAWLDYDGTEALEVTFGVQDSPDGPVTWGTPQTWTPGASQSLTPRIAGRFLAVRLHSEGVGWWKVGALTIDWVKQGLR
jgi:hypothetical protein